VVPEFMEPTNGMLLEHIARYQFAIPYAKGRVLDFACGSGFGSQIIAKAQKKQLDEIVAIDNDADIINYARGHHYHPLINFRKEHAADPLLPQKLGLFDLIISYETI